MNLKNNTKLNRELIDNLSNRGIQSFTKTQAIALESGLWEGNNLLISAPTSAGKTTIAEIAAVQGALNGRKTVYLVTLRALAEEKYRQFNLYYGSQEDKWFDVSIATGDHTEGGWANGILVSTYEKFLAQISGNQEINLSETIIILDEIQILSDKTRGSDIEILCTIIKRHKPHQFIGLSATLPNAKEIADWLECDCIEVKERDVPLKQEVWYQGERYYRYHNADDTYKDDKFSFQSTNTEEIVNYLLSEELGPILVFTMTRPRARELANFLSRIREIKTQSMVITEQLELFSEVIFPRFHGHIVKHSFSIHTASGSDYQ